MHPPDSQPRVTNANDCLLGIFLINYSRFSFLLQRANENRTKMSKAAAARPPAFLRVCPAGSLSASGPPMVPSPMDCMADGWQGRQDCFLKTCEKIALFYSAACEKFSRTSWLRCLTPVRTEFSRHAENFPHAALQNSQFLKWFSKSNPAAPAIHPPCSP